MMNESGFRFRQIGFILHENYIPTYGDMVRCECFCHQIKPHLNRLYTSNALLHLVTTLNCMGKVVSNEQPPKRLVPLTQVFSIQVLSS